MWVEDLVFTKTFIGFRCPEAIIRRIASHKMQGYRLASPKEESLGIDGFIGNDAVSIKPKSYKQMTMLPEKLQGKVVYYQKVKGGIKVEFDF